MQTNKGFTLIELLVVVLIIGILAAIALPQYQKAVEKARMTEAIMMVEAIAKANDRYFLANNEYTRDINNLDIDIPGEDDIQQHIAFRKTKNFMFASSNVSGEFSRKALAQRIPFGTKYALSVSFNGARSCFTYSQASAQERKLCSEWANGKVTNVQ